MINPVGTPYPYIYSMSFYSTHDDYCDICFGTNPIYTWANVPGEAKSYGNGGGFWSSSVDSTVGIFVYPGDGLHKLEFNTVTNKYAMSGSSIDVSHPRTGSLTGPLQIITIFSDNRNGGSWSWNFQSPVTVTFAVSPGKFKTYSMNFNNPSYTSNFYSATITIDSRLINYQAFNPTLYPIYQDLRITGPFNTPSSIALQVSSITSP